MPELLGPELAGRLRGELPARLAAVDPELQRLWAGATQALRSGNADRVRHASVSVRELFDHALRRLAPDEKIAAWSQEPKLKDRGRYTRAARLEYLARDVQSGRFADFTKKSHSAALAALALLQAGTHSLEEPFDDLDAERLVWVVGAHLLLILPRRED